MTFLPAGCDGSGSPVTIHIVSLTTHNTRLASVCVSFAGFTRSSSRPRSAAFTLPGQYPPWLPLCCDNQVGARTRAPVQRHAAEGGGRQPHDEPGVHVSSPHHQRLVQLHHTAQQVAPPPACAALCQSNNGGATCRGLAKKACSSLAARNPRPCNNKLDSCEAQPRAGVHQHHLQDDASEVLWPGVVLVVTCRRRQAAGCCQGRAALARRRRPRRHVRHVDELGLQAGGAARLRPRRPLAAADVRQCILGEWAVHPGTPAGACGVGRDKR